MTTITQEQLTAMLRGDLHVDELNIIEASLETPTLHAKYMQFSTKVSYELHKLEAQLRTLRALRYKYYAGYEKDDRGRLCQEKYTKKEAELLIDADPEVQELEEKVLKKQLLLNRLSETIKTIQFRHLNIKNAIEWSKLQNGVV